MTATDPTGAAAAELAAELVRWRSAGQTACLWLRDDDAVAATPALDRLLALSRDHAVPVLIAAIPMRIESSLAARLVHEPLVETAVHGAWHVNHAPEGRKSEEMAPERGLDVLRAEIAGARGRLIEAFGEAAGHWYVPPWNRIQPEAAALLPELGFKALSTFTDMPAAGCAGLSEINTHIDLIDWKGGKAGRPVAWLLRELTHWLALRRASPDPSAPIGVLAHHLQHDMGAWRGLQALLSATAAHPAIRWRSPSYLLEARPAGEVR